MTRPCLRAVAVTGAAALTLSIALAPAAAAPPSAHDEQIGFQEWSRYPDWRRGHHDGTTAVPGRRPGVTIAEPAGTVDYPDPHTGTTATWEYATWTSPSPRPASARANSSPPGTPTPRPAPGSRSSCRAPTHRRHQPLVRDGTLGRRRRRHPPHHRRPPGRRLLQHLDRHLRHRRRRRRGAARRVPAAPDPPPRPRQRRVALRPDARRDELVRAGPVHGHAEPRRDRLGPGAGGAAALADDPPGQLPRVRRRRPGLVQPDVDRRWCWSTTAASPPPRTWPGSPPATPTRRSPTPPG